MSNPVATSKPALRPDLNQTEWLAVSVALNDAADCGCAVPPAPGSLRDKMGKLVSAVTGHRPKRPLADPRLEALRRFVCATRARRRPAEQFASELIGHGYSRSQIDALALLSA